MKKVGAVSISLFLLACASTPPTTKSHVADQEEFELEVSPGLKPEVVRQAVVPLQKRLGECARYAGHNYVRGAYRLDDDTDDRVEVAFVIGVDGSVTAEQVRGEFLTPSCLKSLVESLRFEHKASEKVAVVWRTRFALSAEQRQAMQEQQRKDLQAICRAVTASLPETLSADDLSAYSLDTAAVAKLAPQLSGVAGELASVFGNLNPTDIWTLYEAYAEEQFIEPDCPRLRQFHALHVAAFDQQ